MRQRKYQLGSERAFQAIWFGLLLLLLVTPLPALAEPDYPALPIEGLTEGEPATVIEVTDGDTLTLDDGRVLAHLQRDDGIFWMSKEEFFKYFHNIYLCAKDMSEFLRD